MRTLASVAVTALLLVGCTASKDPFPRKTTFDGNAALAYAKQHLEFGPRTPGTAAHDKAGEWIAAEMRKRADTVIVQKWTQKTLNGTMLELQNIIARFNPKATDRVLYLTHWDTRPVADEDPNPANRGQPILGANDGASGVGLFLALGDVLKRTPPSVGVDLLFTDGEDWGTFDPDSGGITWRDALFGSQHFAANPPSADYHPLFGVLFDLIGDANLHLWPERNSVQRAPEIVNRVWGAARYLGYDAYFRDKTGQSLVDDHLPLLNMGWRVIDLVNWPYGVLPSTADPDDRPNPTYHHAMADTFDKLSARSLQIVGDVAVELLK